MPEKIIVEFTNTQKASLALSSVDLCLAVMDFDSHLRSLHKYGDDERLGNYAYDIQQVLHEKLGERGLTLYTLLD